MSYAIAGNQKPAYQPPSYQAPPCNQNKGNSSSTALAVAININLPGVQEKEEKKSGKAGKHGKNGKNGKNGKAGKNCENQEYFSPLHQCDQASPCGGGDQSQGIQQLVGLLLKLLSSANPGTANCGANAGMGSFLGDFGSPKFF